MANFYDISAASSKLEELLVEVVREERQKRDVLANELSQAADFWNNFNEGGGSFADEHSTL